MVILAGALPVVSGYITIVVGVISQLLGARIKWFYP
jgi:hypothetical protein